MIGRRPLLFGAAGAALLARYAPTYARAQTTDRQDHAVTPPPEMSRAFQASRAAGVPALAVAADNRDGRRLALAEGFRAIGRPARVTRSDSWHLGSIGKSMTATLVARLVERGSISWDDTVANLLGMAIPDMRGEYRDLNFRHLLSHRGGLQANIEEAQEQEFPRLSADPRADRMAYSRLGLLQRPVGAKETTVVYSNTGYVIAGAMLEARLGRPWESLIEEHVFKPLDMASAGQGPPGRPGAYDQPVGHAVGPSDMLEPFLPGSPLADNSAALGPAGRVHASLTDVLKFLRVHCDRSAPFLRSESWDTLHTPPFGSTVPYAMGWQRRGNALWHSGSNGKWYGEVIVMNSTGVVAVAAINDGRPDVRAPLGDALKAAAQAVG